ncbi:biotin transporter BioY [Catenisphaera adipataccumulans]|jgi:biotin transport system substrate-specific component|uniref:Biotin transporter n=1 Tax=Catenisphaera adipataccumulans TaxID=700500 RepID=A0A7W8CWE3_9FIRM|nr:biotin transporter BioY [Catenisphaera adipataccumulans]MBB5182835.1 biotin transport system substrate-specific component [Catenisphaera adipataccumulans]
MKTREIVLCAMMAAVIAVLAPLSIPLSGGVPISLATFAVMLAGAVLGPKYGTISTVVYLVLGAVGVPVFAGYTSGFGILAGPTGGYLIGYLPLAFCTGWFHENFSKQKYGLIVGMLVGEVILYVIGTVWFMFVNQTGLMQSLVWCVFPFIPGDIAKIIAVMILTPLLQKAVHLQKVKTA